MLKGLCLLGLMIGIPIGSNGAPNGQTSAEREFCKCVKELKVPRYSPIARKARMSGTATARITIGRDPKSHDVVVDGVEKPLSVLVESSLRASDYASECEGLKFDMFFTFAVAGRPGASPEHSFSFKPPNQFVITVNPDLMDFMQKHGTVK